VIKIDAHAMAVRAATSAIARSKDHLLQDSLLPRDGSPVSSGASRLKTCVLRNSRSISKRGAAFTAARALFGSSSSALESSLVELQALSKAGTAR